MPPFTKAHFDYLFTYLSQLPQTDPRWATTTTWATTTASSNEGGVVKLLRHWDAQFVCHTFEWRNGAAYYSTYVIGLPDHGTTGERGFEGLLHWSEATGMDVPLLELLALDPEVAS